MISDQQDNNLSQAAAASKKRAQDRVNPMVINIHDGRLMPNTPKLRVHKDYRVFTGDINATLPDRMRWLTGTKHQPIRVVNSADMSAEFDIGAASKEDIVTFAFEQYGVVLEATRDIRTLRKEVLRLFEASKVPEPA